MPQVFSSLPNLEYLYISDAFISGDLPYMVGMPNMIEHWIDVNPGLGGTMPSGVGNIGTLKSFSVTQARVGGNLPTELGKLTNMKQMWLYANVFTGKIPPQLALKSTSILQLEGNSFSGTVPSEICQLTQFPATNMTTLGADCAALGVSTQDISPERSHLPIYFSHLSTSVSFSQCSQTTCCTCCTLKQCNPTLFP